MKDSRKPSIYIASKTKHAPKWLALREQGLHIISTWIDEYLKGSIEDVPAFAARCVAECCNADFLILYGEKGEILKDASVEFGCALANNKKVLIAGSCDTLGKIMQFHPNVKRVDTMEQALATIASHHQTGNW